ncbi:MAG: hypothetical protein E6R13_00800 [Spirochaetes bacterium]|nr:MAG: hypothetical protein E6R13_00800 [Spirochaetota bacterium]
MITLTGSTSISTLSKTIQAPQDSIDNVDQFSVQPPFQSLLNNIYSTIDKLPYLKPSLSMSCLDGTNITIKAFSGLWASKNALSLDYTTLQRTNDVTLSGTAVFGGGGYVANTTYYVYAKYDPAKTESTDFVLRTDAPDTTKTWLVAGVTQYNHRYIGSVLTNSLATCEVFSCSNGDYNLGTSNSGSTFTDIVFTDIQYLMLPKTATSIKLQITCQNTTAATDGSFYIKPKGTSSIRFIDVPRSSLYRGADVLEIPCIGSPSFNIFQIRFQGAGLVNGDCTAKLGMVGYKE